jgi:hypothetical protein
VAASVLLKLGTRSGDGSDVGEAAYLSRVKVGEEALLRRRFRVLDIVPFEEEDESPFVGLLQVQPSK